MIQNPKIRAFVELYKKKPMPKTTVKDFIKAHNHEIWRKCPKCGNYEDLRKTFYCKDCGAQIDPNFN